MALVSRQSRGQLVFVRPDQLQTGYATILLQDSLGSRSLVSGLPSRPGDARPESHEQLLRVEGARLRFGERTARAPRRCSGCQRRTDHQKAEQHSRGHRSASP